MSRLLSALLALTLVAGVSGVGPAGAQTEADEIVVVNNEPEYRAALVFLAGEIGSHTIQLGADFPIDDGTDPFWVGGRQLLIDGQGHTITVAGNSRALVLTGSTGLQLTFHDITITGARAGANSVGGGAVLYDGPLVLDDATFDDNQVSDTNARRGGAVYTDGDLTITGSTFTNNIAATVTGAASGGAVAASGNLTITGSTFQANRAQSTNGVASGGAASADGESTITDTTFTGNTTESAGVARGGAVHLSIATNAFTTPDVIRSTFANNTSTSTGGFGFGGAIVMPSGAVDIDGSRFLENGTNSPTDASGGAVFVTDIADIADSAFVGNVADGDVSAVGGAIAADTVVVRASSMTGNKAMSPTGVAEGGAVSGGDLIEFRDSGVARNTITSAGGGAGAALRGDPEGVIEVVNSTVADNEGQDSGPGGAVAGGDVTLSHATVARNQLTGTPLAAANITADLSLTSFASVVADPRGGTANCDIGSPVGTHTHNYDDDGSCGFDDLTDVSNGADARLGPARHNGDLVAATEAGNVGVPRESAYPLNGSPLIDAIEPGDCATDPALDLDQRGIPRPFGSGCDIGAVEAVFPAHGFSDVTPFYEPTVRWITSAINLPNILDGYDDGTFRQTLNITRGQVARMYYRAAGEPDLTGVPAHGFTDVTTFFEDAVRWAKDEGIFDGYDDDTFRQANPITRGNFIRSLYGFAGSPSVGGLPDHGFTDVTPFYEAAVKWAKANLIADGFGNNTFRQRNNISRGNASRTAYNAAQAPDAWDAPGSAPTSMLFQTNTVQ